MSPLDDVARQGFNGSAERLSKRHGCTSMRQEVLADCELERNQSNKNDLEPLPHSLRPLRSLALALANHALFVHF